MITYQTDVSSRAHLPIPLPRGEEKRSFASIRYGASPLSRKEKGEETERQAIM